MKLQEKLHKHHRQVTLAGEFTYETISTLLQEDDPTQHLLVNLCSPGGEIELGFAIYDYLKSRSGAVTVIGYGLVASSAILVLAAADTRILAPNTAVLLHGTYVEYGDGETRSVHHLRDEAKNLAAAQRRYIATLVTTCSPAGGPEDVVKKKLTAAMKGETQLSASDAVVLGLAQSVLTYHERSK